MTKALLYLNGYNTLGNGGPRPAETRVFEQLEQLGIIVVHAQIDWKKPEVFPDFLGRLASQSLELLNKADRLTIAGFSGGGGMSVNLFGRLAGLPVTAISIAGRVSSKDLTPDDEAHWRDDPQRKKLYDSVKDCESIIIPNLSADERGRIITLIPERDDSVPITSMIIPGAQVMALSGVKNHLKAGAVGLRLLPDLLADSA